MGCEICLSIRLRPRHAQTPLQESTQDHNRIVCELCLNCSRIKVDEEEEIRRHRGRPPCPGYARTNWHIIWKQLAHTHTQSSTPLSRQTYTVYKPVHTRRFCSSEARARADLMRIYYTRDERACKPLNGVSRSNLFSTLDSSAVRVFADGGERASEHKRRLFPPRARRNVQ